jgi:hypothetical protein
MCGINIIRAQQKVVQAAQQSKGYVHLIGGVRVAPAPHTSSPSTAKSVPQTRYSRDATGTLHSYSR